MQQTQKVIVIVLVVVAVGLGYLIYSKNQPMNGGNQPPANNGQNQSGSKELTEQEKKLFAVPGPDASAEQKKAHYELAASLASTAGEVKINGCEADPKVLQVKEDTTFKVTNTGNEDIQFGFDKTVTVAAGKTVEVKADFTNGTGIYGYSCNQPINRPIGFILVTPN